MKKQKEILQEEKPFVVIRCTVFNHAPFLRKSLEGMVMQKTNFKYIAIVHDDVSTDGSVEIIREYAEKYPDIIYPIYETENQYSKGLIPRIMQEACAATGAPLIAYCEGDDYWTDPYKLQKQADFMVAHPEYSATWTRCTHHDYERNIDSEDGCGFLFAEKGVEGVDVTREMFFANWITQPLTMMYRTDAYLLDWYPKYSYYRDMHEIYHLLGMGRGYLFAFNGGVYNKHSSGIFGKVDLTEACETGLHVAEELYRVNQEPTSKTFYEHVLQWNIDKAKEIGANRRALSWRLFCLNHKWKKLLKNLIIRK